MKHRVEELEGALLDAAVALAEGIEVRVYPDGIDAWRVAAGGRGMYSAGTYSPSTDGALAVPIIERERIALRPSSDEWVADWMGPRGTFVGLGPTPLIAAMRAYIASRFGDVVELP